MTWLEICGKNRDCSGTCPYSENGFGEYGECRETLMTDALALLKEQEHKDKMFRALEDDWKRLKELLKEQEAVVHPEPSCEMTYITDCCCDLCGVQLIREDNFCRGCGKPIDWSKRLKGGD